MKNADIDKALPVAILCFSAIFQLGFFVDRQGKSEHYFFKLSLSDSLSLSGSLLAEPLTDHPLLSLYGPITRIGGAIITKWETLRKELFLWKIIFYSVDLTIINI